VCLWRWTWPLGDFDKHPARTVDAVADPAESGRGLVEKVEDLRCVGWEVVLKTLELGKVVCLCVVAAW
jgi:hypothetical protein